MRCYILEDSFIEIEKDSIANLLIDFFKVTDYIDENSNSSLHLNVDIYNVQIFNNLKLYEWLFVDEEYVAELQEVKRLLQTTLDRKIKECERDEYIITKQEIESLSANEVMNNVFICLKNVSDKAAYINTVDELIKAFRICFGNNCTIENFIELANEAFPRLYFREEVEESLKTLSAPLVSYRGEIRIHLEDINDYFKQVYNDNISRGLKDVVLNFQTKSRVKCTLEGAREETKDRLTFIFRDKNNKEIGLLCEPHTKLEKTGQAGDTEYRYDRIYFHQGDDRIDTEKVLIAYIGKHL